MDVLAGRDLMAEMEQAEQDATQLSVDSHGEHELADAHAVARKQRDNIWRITVQTLNGKEHAFKIRPDASILELKSLIMRSLGTPIENQVLMCSNSALFNASCVRVLFDGATVSLIIQEATWERWVRMHKILSDGLVNVELLAEIRPLTAHEQNKCAIRARSCKDDYLFEQGMEVDIKCKGGEHSDMPPTVAGEVWFRGKIIDVVETRGDFGGPGMQQYGHWWSNSYTVQYDTLGNVETNVGFYRLRQPADNLASAINLHQLPLADGLLRTAVWHVRSLSHHNFKTLVSKLLEAGADPNAEAERAYSKAEQNMTPLMMVMFMVSVSGLTSDHQQGLADTALLLLEHGADPRACTGLRENGVRSISRRRRPRRKLSKEAASQQTIRRLFKGRSKTRGETTGASTNSTSTNSTSADANKT